MKKSNGYLGNINLKREGEQIAFTQEQIKEYIKCRDDKIYFAEHYFKIISLDEGLITIKLWDHQKRFLDLLSNNRYVVGLCGRQTSKSTTITIDILHYLLFNDHKTCVILANKLATAREIFSRVQLAYENLPKWLQQGVVEWNKSSCKLENGSRVVCAASTGSSIRGMSVDYLFVDEVAFIEANIWNDFYSATFPTISSGKNSRIVLVSTANGLNHFYKIFTKAKEGKSEFAWFEADWTCIPTRDEEWKRQTIANTSEEAFAQEHCNHFMGSSLTLISSSKLSTLTEKTPKITEGSLKIYEDVIKDHNYIMVVDVSRGKGLDNSAFSVIDISDHPFVQVAAYYDSNISPLIYPSVIEKVAKHYNEAAILVETNDIGESIATNLHYDKEYPNVIWTQDATKKAKNIGIRTTKSVKLKGCLNLKDMIEKDVLITNDKDTIQELVGFVQSGNSYEADSGYHDDLVMTLVLFAWFTTTPQFTHFKQDFAIDQAFKEHIDHELESFNQIFIDDGLDEANQHQFENNDILATHIC